MKDAIRGGHNYQSTGASALINEVVEDRLVKDATIKYLKIAGEITVDATPGNCTQSVDLKFGTDTANKAKADLYVPIHFNAAYKTYTGAIGSEIWLNPKNAKAVEIGTKILNNLEALGFKNRGLKDGMTQHKLHDIRQSHMKSVLIETCFVEATEDVRIYKAVGADRVGKAISEGILGRSITSNIVNIILTAPVVSTQMYRVRKSWAEGGSQLGAFTVLTQEVKDLCNKNAGYEVYNAIGTQVYPAVTATKATIVPVTRVNNSIAQLQAELNRQGAHLIVDGFYGPKTLKACPTVRVGAQGNITKWLQKRLAIKLQDGIFGGGTLGEVKNYQIALRLSSDGVVGENTWDALLR